MLRRCLCGARQGARGTTVYFAYGDRGERTELTMLGQDTVYYEYGPALRMKLVLDGKTDSATYYEYDGAGKVTAQAHPNGSTTYFSYDGAGRLSEKVTKKDADGSVLVKFAYTRDAEGSPIAIEREPGLGVYYYEHDVLQRLAYEGQFIAAARQYENYYEYDLAGNRTLLRHGETGAENLTYYDHNAANELTQLHDKDGWTYFAYDATGNTTEEQTPSYTRYYDWDGRGMLTGVRSTEGGWTDNEYRYDGLATRVMTVESGGQTYYDWDGIRVLQQKDSAGTVTERHVHGHSPIVSVGDIAHIDKSGTVYVPVADRAGTIWNLLGASAAKANAYTYDAFGVGRSASETASNLYRFVGRRGSPAVGLYDLPGGAYSAPLGRLVQAQVPWDRLFPIKLGHPKHRRPPAPPAAPAAGLGKKCAGGEIVVPDPDHVPSTNGCGPADWRGALVPDNPFWIGSFAKPCDNHDICYGTCEADKAGCDRQFLHDMEVACFYKYGLLSVELPPNTTTLGI